MENHLVAVLLVAVSFTAGFGICVVRRAPVDWCVRTWCTESRALCATTFTEEMEIDLRCLSLKEITFTKQHMRPFLLDISQRHRGRVRLRDVVHTFHFFPVESRPGRSAVCHDYDVTKDLCYQDFWHRSLVSYSRDDIVNIICLNLLIAILSNTYDMVQAS